MYEVVILNCGEIETGEIEAGIQIRWREGSRFVSPYHTSNPKAFSTLVNIHFLSVRDKMQAAGLEI